MDLNAVSRALHALHMLYARHFITIGCLAAYSRLKGKNHRISCRLRRISITEKTFALVEHDRILTGDNHG